MDIEVERVIEMGEVIVFERTEELSMYRETVRLILT
jgi:hypothetical protein